MVENQLDGETYGIELSADYHPMDFWRLRASYTYLQVQLHLPENSLDAISEAMEGHSPHHQFSLWSSADLNRDVSLDAILRFVDDLPNLAVEDYVTLDLRLGWHLTESLELSLAARNLLEDQHIEYKPTLINTIPTAVERSLYAKITWRF